MGTVAVVTDVSIVTSPENKPTQNTIISDTKLFQLKQIRLKVVKHI